MRISRDDMLMRFAIVTAMRGTCTRLSVGAILARDGRPISQGYVGSPPGEPHCTDVGCLVEDDHCIRTSHAEENALLFAARYGIYTEGAELFITHSPCKTRCTKSIITAGIKRVVYAVRYKDAELSDRQLRQAGVKVEWFNDPDRRRKVTPETDTEQQVQSVQPV